VAYEIRDYIRSIADFPKPGMTYHDVAALEMREVSV